MCLVTFLRFFCEPCHILPWYNSFPLATSMLLQTVAAYTQGNYYEMIYIQMKYKISIKCMNYRQMWYRSLFQSDLESFLTSLTLDCPPCTVLLVSVNWCQSDRFLIPCLWHFITEAWGIFMHCLFWYFSVM